MKKVKMNAKKVLIVDDEKNIVISLSFLLEREGYQIASASNGKEAIEAYKSFRPDVILLDVMMPEMDGYEAARKIRALDDASCCHIVFLTAKGTQQNKIEGYRSGAELYIVKPFDNQEILEVLAEITA